MNQYTQSVLVIVFERHAGRKKMKEQSLGGFQLLGFSQKIHVSLLPPPLLHFPRHAGGRGSQLAVVLCLGNVSQV